MCFDLTRSGGGVLWAALLMGLWPHGSLHGQEATKDRGAPAAELPGYAPILPLPQGWSFNDYWTQRRAGRKDFYMMAQGPYLYQDEHGIEMLKQVGLYESFIPGHTNLVPYGFDNFAPSVREKLSPIYKRLAESYLENQWPFQSMLYLHNGNPLPSEAALKAVGDLWLGEGGGEDPTYRLEPVFHYLKTGGKWQGSSMYTWSDEWAKKFFAERLLPLLDKELPFYKDPDHRWTHGELRRLSDLYCEEFYRPTPRLIAWGMHLSPWLLASLPKTPTICEKGADALHAARGQGLLRQFGDKFFLVWRGYEPLRRYYAPDRAVQALAQGPDAGYPLPLVWYYLFRPYLIGANAYVNEMFPAALVHDIEGDGQYELTTLGQIGKKLIDFTERHPERGVNYAPIALLMEYTRQLPNDVSPGGTYYGYNLPFDDADQMNAGVVRSLFPEHRHVRFTGDYGTVAPYGELFNILSPNLPGRTPDARALANYKVLVALGGQKIDEDYAAVLKRHVAQGGALVINVEDLGQHLEPEFFGVKIHAETLRGRSTRCETDSGEFAEKEFDYRRLELAGAEALYTCQGRPLATRHKVGDGHAILVAARYMIQNQEAPLATGRTKAVFASKPILKFVPDFFEHLTASVSPIEFRRRPEDKEDLSWLVQKKGDGWVVAVFNYSIERELVTWGARTASVMDEYRLKSLPFEIVCRTPVQDVLEWYEDRDVAWRRRDGRAVLSDTICGGEIRVYEFQPHRIELAPRTRPVNYALNRPIAVSSTLTGYSPQVAVDGRLDNDQWWQSDSDAKRHYVFDMPQWLEVDLGELKTIDHVLLAFRYEQLQSLDTRLRVYKHLVEASLDRREWTVVLDERKNEKPARHWPLERWFPAAKARYVRLTVLRNAAFSGAQVVELQVTGPERETYQPTRSPCRDPESVVER